MYENDFELLEKKYSRLIYKFLSNKSISGYEKEDLYQECLMVLDSANKTYDPSLGVQFITFFYINMRNRISNIIRDQGGEKRPNIIFVDVDSALLLNTPSDEDIEEDHEKLKIFATILHELLTYPRGDITYKIYVMGMTANEVADDEGVSKQRISFLNKRNLKKLNTFLKEKGLLFKWKSV